MTLAELRKLTKYLPGSTIVRIYADHGQSSMLATTVTPMRMDAKSARAHMLDDIDDVEVGVPVVEIGAP